MLQQLLAFLTAIWPTVASAIKGAFIAFAVNRATQQSISLEDAQKTLTHAAEANKVERAVGAADAAQLDDIWLRINNAPRA